MTLGCGRIASCVRPRRFFPLLLLLPVAIAGCSARGELQYTVRRGDTLYEIGRRHGVAHAEIARVNRLRDAERIFPGQSLRIPNGRSAPVRAAVPQPRASQPRAAAPLLWPVAGGRLSSPFGPRDAAFHEGIDISAPTGTPVLAAERGVVVFSGVRRGFGNVVVVRHTPRLATVYAHNQTNWVRVGQPVRRGEVIAAVGETGRTSGPNLHFEVWAEKRVVDPSTYLAERASIVAEADLDAP